jgi:hypothetical protein
MNTLSQSAMSDDGSIRPVIGGGVIQDKMLKLPRNGGSHSGGKMSSLCM